MCRFVKTLDFEFKSYFKLYTPSAVILFLKLHYIEEIFSFLIVPLIQRPANKATAPLLPIPTDTNDSYSKSI